MKRSARKPGFRPGLERLEERDTPSTLFVVPSNFAVNRAPFYHSFAAAYAAAQTGDVIQIQPGATVGGLATLDIAKSITIQGNPNDAPHVIAREVEVLSGTSNVVFKNLDFTNAQGLVVDGGHQDITVEDCKISLLTMKAGAGDASDVITGNTFTGGAAVIVGDSNGTTADRITNNKFINSSSLYVQNDADALVSGNTFNVSQNQDPFAAVSLVNDPSLLFWKNSVTISNADANTAALFVQDTPYLPQFDQDFTYVEDNTFNTAGKGVGLDADGGLSASIEGNDFRNNAVGVFLNGEGSPMTVDLGGGPLGSLGQNNFSTFTRAGDAMGHFAIVMENTPANEVVCAFDNIWNNLPRLRNPLAQLFKDGSSNTSAQEAIYPQAGFSAGTGDILTHAG
jgi:nitrous oxidase accessory protein NosD